MCKVHNIATCDPIAINDHFQECFNSSSLFTLNIRFLLTVYLFIV